MNPTDNRVVEAVTVEDRRAATEMLMAMWAAQHGNVVFGWMRDEESATLSGKRDDGWAVQAFARHRRQAAEREREACAAVADTLFYPDETKISASIRDAIRSCQENGDSA